MTALELGPTSHETVHTFCTLGVGRHGLSVIEHLLGTGRWKLVSAVDRSAAAYAYFQYKFHDYHVPFYSTPAEALAATQPEVIHIAATAPAHVPLAMAVLETGSAGHLLIEKPIATSLSEANSLLTRLQSSPNAGRAAVDFNRRCSKLYHAAKVIIESAELGKLRHIDYKRAMKLGVKGSHYIDLMNWFMDGRPAAVTAQLAADSDVDTRGAFFYDPQGYVEIEYESGQTACLDGLGRRDDLAEGMCLQFERGRIQIDIAEKTTRLENAAGERLLVDDASLNVFQWIENTFAALVNPDAEFTPCSLAEAADSLAVIVAAHQSQRLGGKPVPFPLSPEAQAEVLRLA